MFADIYFRPKVASFSTVTTRRPSGLGHGAWRRKNGTLSNIVRPGQNLTRQLEVEGWRDFAGKGGLAAIYNPYLTTHAVLVGQVYKPYFLIILSTHLVR